MDSISVFLTAIITIVSYILGAVGLCQLAKFEGIQNIWLAWVPIGNYYVTGLLLKDNFSILQHRISNPENVLPMSAIAVIVGTQTPFSIFMCIAFGVPIVFSIYHMLKKYRVNHAVALTSISVIIPFVYPIILFTIRNFALTSSGNEK